MCPPLPPSRIRCQALEELRRSGKTFELLPTGSELTGRLDLNRSPVAYFLHIIGRAFYQPLPAAGSDLATLVVKRVPARRKSNPFGRGMGAKRPSVNSFADLRTGSGKSGSAHMVR